MVYNNNEFLLFCLTYLFAGHTNRRSLAQNAILDHYTHDDWITRIKYELWQNLMNKYTQNIYKHRSNRSLRIVRK